MVIWTLRARADLNAIHDHSERKVQREIAGRGGLVSYTRSLTPMRTCNKSADSERKLAMTH